MSIPYATQTLSGWGRYERQQCEVYRPEQARAIEQVLRSNQHDHYIARGLGRSYGDAAVNEGGGVIDFSRLNRMMAFDPASGILECEAGVSLAGIIATFLPQGWFLPVTPGTKFVTVGGAIANDVHGKNHHRDGTFGQFVVDFGLFTPNRGLQVCSRAYNTGLFWATIGGIGLTGIILTARIQLQRVPSAYISVDYHKSRNLEDALSTMHASDERYQYSVAWVNCLARGKKLGQSVLMRGNHATVDQLPARFREQPYQVKPRREVPVPIDFPGIVLNAPLLRTFNKLFYGMHRSVEGVITDYNRYFYPLDSIHHWNRMYGKRGFVQYQATLPPESVGGLVRLLERLGQSGRASFLGVLKCFGESGAGLLSHPMKGYTLTLDIPNKSGLPPFLHELDEIVLAHGGRLYLAKDATASGEVIAEMYPKLDAFCAIKGEVDPDNRLSSSMARRLGIVSL
ncbi:FAD-binding oxidoreductase [Roseovarius pacificus]|uniref:FAD-binding oxidoreductase n=1 Tax=Roseovarius pacificus TaxID=337701 RepID=UPI002A18B9C2|nr:FAD-binding oxidoreductase [Roseovarius pacificus]